MPGWVLPWSPHCSMRKCSPSPMSETAGSTSFETGQSKPSPPDHSWVAEQILKGFITEEEAERSPAGTS